MYYYILKLYIFYIMYKLVINMYYKLYIYIYIYIYIVFNIIIITYLFFIINVNTKSKCLIGPNCMQIFI